MFEKLLDGLAATIGISNKTRMISNDNAPEGYFWLANVPNDELQVYMDAANRMRIPFHQAKAFSGSGNWLPGMTAFNVKGKRRDMSAFWTMVRKLKRERGME